MNVVNVTEPSVPWSRWWKHAFVLWSL